MEDLARTIRKVGDIPNAAVGNRGVLEARLLIGVKKNNGNKSVGFGAITYIPNLSC